MEYFYKITVYFKNEKPVSEIKRFLRGGRGDIEDAELDAAREKYRNNVHRVDAWLLPETDPEVQEYKRKWS